MIVVTELYKSPFFWLGLLFKLSLLWWPGSHYLNELFIPFLDTAVLNFGSNPWSLSSPESFPYGSILFVSLFLPKFILYKIVGMSALGVTPLGIGTIKGVLLCFDLLLLIILLKFSIEDMKRILGFYWLNPILIYISYIYGQLDIASISLCACAAYFLSSNRIVISALTMAAAILCKFHVAILLPFWIAYLWQGDFLKESLRKILVFASIVAGTVFIGFLPLILAGRFGSASIMSPEISRLFALAIPLGQDEFFYVGVLLVVSIIGRLCISSRITPTGLLFGSGLIMGTLVLGTHAAPGWYYWVVPFIALASSRYVTFPKISLFAVIVFYFAHFASSSYLLDTPLFKNILFTILQTSLLGALISMYQVAIRSEAPLASFSKALMIGIAGDSGVGKNHLAQLIADIFGLKNSTIVEGDDYHKWERGHESWERYTHLNPKANHLVAMAKHATLFSQGRRAVQRSYDHSTGIFTLPRVVSPNRTVIMQGLHTLYLCGLRKELDLKIFVKCSDELRLIWKLRRDTSQRGLTAARVLDSMKKRSGDAEKFISQQETTADWIISYFPKDQTPIDHNSTAAVDIGVTLNVPNDFDFEDLLSCIEEHTDVSFDVQFDEHNMDRVSITASGLATAHQIEKVANIVFEDMRRLTRSLTPPQWQSNLNGIIQLFTLGFIARRENR